MMMMMNNTVCFPQGKVFPKLRKRSSTARLIDQDRNGEEQTAADYVFRIVYPGYRYDASELGGKKASSFCALRRPPLLFEPLLKAGTHYGIPQTDMRHRHKLDTDLEATHLMTK